MALGKKLVYVLLTFQLLSPDRCPSFSTPHLPLRAISLWPGISSEYDSYISFIEGIRGLVLSGKRRGREVDGAGKELNEDMVSAGVSVSLTCGSFGT